MNDKKTKRLTIAVSSRALFDFEDADRVFQKKGLSAYRAHQRRNAREIPKNGTAFDLIKGLLDLNASEPGPDVEVVVLSRNSKDTRQRLEFAIRNSGLPLPSVISLRARPIHKTLCACSTDLFLSRAEADVREATAHGIASAIISAPPKGFAPNDDAICIAFDGDAVLFSSDSERIYKTQGLEAFLHHETENEHIPLERGPFANVLCLLANIQRDKKSRLRLALVSARNQSAGTRMLHTLNKWGVDLNEIHFLGGVGKSRVLAAMKAHMFFDDQQVHVGPASRVVPAALVPCFALKNLEG